MMKENYEEQLLQKCVEIYERRKYYSKREGDRKSAINVRMQDIFLTYRDPFEYKRYRDIHRAVVRLIQQGILAGVPDEQGYFDKLHFLDETIDQCYERLGVMSAAEVSGRMMRILDRYDRESLPLVHRFCEMQRELLTSHRKLIYGLDQNEEKMEDVLRVLTMLDGLQEEMTVRDFSEELFGDPEWFSQIRMSIQNILYDLTEPVVERERMLERFHLVDEPTYLHIKGRVFLTGSHLLAELSEMDGGIAVTTRMLPDIEKVVIGESVVIVTDDEKVFHDTDADGCVVICLGGFPNRERVEFLRKIYQQNPEANYGFKGDIDVYGFLTFEYLRAETEIPLLLFEMDLVTLQKYRRAGKCSEMLPVEKRLIGLTRLEHYREVLDYMEEYNCKLEWRKV